MTRPIGVGAGALGLGLAWAGAFALVRLTGATPVVIVLVAGFVLCAAAVASGWWNAGRPTVETVVLPGLATAGEPIAVAVVVDSPRPVWVVVSASGDEVAAGWTLPDVAEGDRSVQRFAGTGRIAARGVVDRVDVDVRSGGSLGLVWWGRRGTVDVERCNVAPRREAGAAMVERARLNDRGTKPGAPGAVAGQVDGIRPWRDGDSERYVHWASTLRSNELVVHDRRRETDQRLIVRARRGTPDPDAEAGRALRAIESGFRDGLDVLVAVDGGEPVVVPDRDAAVAWAAAVDLGETVRPSPRRRIWRAEPETTASVSARWWAAATTGISLLMLIGALELGAALALIALAGVGMGAAATARTIATGAPASPVLRAVVAVGAMVGLVLIVAASGRWNGLLGVLRGPLPQVLVVLVVLHGFECRDRRTIRVAVAIAAILMAYASAFRVDGGVGWWMLAWAIACLGTFTRLAGPTSGLRHAGATSPLTGRVVGGVLAVAAIAGLLVVVPVPDGPARLTLPTLIEGGSDVPLPGAVAGPDGDLADGPSSAGADRAPAGQAGGYTGFAQSMDTSVRGELSDDVVMRVRAPAPDFWRGQTFSNFDGRRWYADLDVGVLREGPNISVPPALGDSAVQTGTPAEEFVQTYFLEADMPNLIFAAYQPEQVIVDADVWTRADGALRASQVMGDGSVYTVVSHRPLVGADTLARQGHVGSQLSEFGRFVFDRYLEVPPSTSPDTVALANELATGASNTYEVVRAYEAWMADNVEYDLNAPLPGDGEDAVHDFLFDSRRGFCEQIASALAIMLRTQGVPTRVATGYLPGDRDPIAGVFEVRGSDAHAWVEVWFPLTGWQAFDPTASVPLAADSEISSVGADLLTGVTGYVGDHPARFVLVVVGAAAIYSLVRLATLAIRRRRRGRWGVLQDRFSRLAVGRGAGDGQPNLRQATAWDDRRRSDALEVAARLDRSAFAPDFVDDDELYDDTRKLVTSLGGRDR